MSLFSRRNVITLLALLPGLFAIPRRAVARTTNPALETRGVAIATDDPQGRTDGPGRQIGNVGEVSVLLTIKPDRKEILGEALKGGASWADSLSTAGTIHDARIVLLPNDQALVAITFDGPWDPYIDHFGKQLAGANGYFWSSFEGYPDDAPTNPAAFRDFIRAHQLPASIWYVAFPELTVAETARQHQIADGFEQAVDAMAN